LTFAFAFALAGTASADTTLGSTSKPSGSVSSSWDGGHVYNQVTRDPGTPYSLPGAGTITQWQTNSAIDAPGASITFLVLKPVGATFTVVGVDTRSIPNPAPPVATFSLATPMAVSGGETLGLFGPTPAVTCYFHDGATPAGATLAQLLDPSPPSPPASGQILNRQGDDSPAHFTMNLAATFKPAPAAGHTGQRAAALKKCKRRHSARARRKCRKSANLLPV